MSLKAKKAELTARYLFRAVVDAAAKLEAAGWGRGTAGDDRLEFELSDKALEWARFAGAAQGRAAKAGQTSLRNPAFFVARLSLLLELMALDCPPAIVATVFEGGDEVTWWAAWSLVEAARGRHDPAWWRKEESWLRSLITEEGCTCTIVQDSSAAWEGLALAAQRLAGCGWFDLAIVRAQSDTMLKCTWPDDLRAVIAELLAPSAPSPAMLLMPDFVVMSVLGRLILLLELWCWGAHGSTARRIMDSGTPLDLWTMRLAELLFQERWKPRWWDKSRGWHAKMQNAMREL